MDDWEREALNAATLLFLSRPKMPEEEREENLVIAENTASRSMSKKRTKILREARDELCA